MDDGVLVPSAEMTGAKIGCAIVFFPRVPGIDADPQVFWHTKTFPRSLFVLLTPSNDARQHHFTIEGDPDTVSRGAQTYTVRIRVRKEHTKDNRRIATPVGQRESEEMSGVICILYR